MTVSEDYGPDFFGMHANWRGDYHLMGDKLAHHLSFDSALDLGCGNGYLLERLQQRGKRVLGVDGSEHAQGHADIPFQIYDLRRPFMIWNWELVISTEVAEHLPAESANILVDTIVRATRRWVYFSAARPGLGGYKHLNEQEKPYWVSKFIARGMTLDVEATDRIAADMTQLVHTWWFAKNAMVFRVA